MIPAVIRLLRPKQWTKNLLVFAAPLFTGSFGQDPILKTVIAFAVMCLASSATYVFNDLRDRERDKLHPKKSKRPIASGEISVGLALAMGIIALVGALGVAFSVNLATLWMVVVYLGLQAIYNLGLKRVPIADVFLIGLGFVVRAVVGAVAIQVEISGWLLFCTAALALMLGFSKRRDEFLRMGDDAAGSRESLASYSRPILDLMVGLFACAAMLSYGIYSLLSSTARAHPALIGTTLFVWYGIARYLYLVFHEGVGEEPETILMTDLHIIFSVILFVVMAGLSVSNVLSLTFIGP